MTFKVFNQNEFLTFMRDNQVLRFYEEPVKLSSGAYSTWYVNWRTVCEDPFLMDKLTDFVIQFALSKSLKVDTFYGVPEGASKLGLFVQDKWARRSPNFQIGQFVLSMGRGKEKDHGEEKDKSFLGVPRGELILLEDVVTTGDSLIKHAIKLKKLGIDVKAAIVLTDRLQNLDIKATLSSMGIEFYPMISSKEMGVLQ